MNGVERRILLEKGIQARWEACIGFEPVHQDLDKGCIDDGGYGGRRRFRCDLKILAGTTSL